jgi:hypothetical protein
VRIYNEIQLDISDYVNSCPPGYFNNEGEVNSPWALFRNWGHGWGAFLTMLEDWRSKDDLAGLEQRKIG